LTQNIYFDVEDHEVPGGEGLISGIKKDGVHKIHELLIYPNPVSQTLTVDINNVKHVSGVVSIFDLHNKMVLSQYFKANNSVFEVNTSGLQNGLYYLSLKTAENNYRHKLFFKN
jgi:hypothetical protein